ncbi:bifunctional diaminohydroxyphosphoribosylaminopyrimidine deaminase/5-amino-6-(5-phosphoribosylamino)uracil reductase RibD [Luteolibacter sp. LG18]|uniref:bifunctional diaminohydroxyphosphoribosylaminopyrimidine deaminase/5-amino-6-(5-phosphoribosylamino)uracil reductase RibD n=1 Tax=Luteolibacter sp. LG18 TaxID=2819286 RepID=UPI002B2A9C15|nr:riboflavin biosynthesis protein RibD [Luteolibacter sp. LG18]
MRAGFNWDSVAGLAAGGGNAEAGGVDDAHWMGLALEEAAKGVGRTAPNPPVGAVLVKDGTLIGRGWHRAAGRPHAEREALADALRNAGAEAIRGSTAYVTLEPCSTYGRTPPCTVGLIEAGVARVVYAVTDRNPAHVGRADALLREAGIEVLAGVREAEATALLRSFFQVQETGRPWVIWKTAMSLDGRLTRPPGEGQWLSSPASRADVQRLRGEVDAILTSGETVRRDRPKLTIREPGLLEGRNQPWRVVVTGQPDSLPRDADLFTDEWRDRTLVRPVADLPDTLRRLAAEQGVLSVLVEAGGLFSAALFEAGCVDEIVVYLAPLLCGGDVPALAGAGLPVPLELADVTYERIGDDVRMRAPVVRG